MIERYTRKKMKMVWSDKHKFEKWLKVELAVLEARARLGEIASMQYFFIRDKAEFTVKRIKELELGSGGNNHEFLAFVNAVREHLPEDLRPLFHESITSYDAIDPALILLLKEAAEILLADSKFLETAILERAKEHKWDFMIGRSHGVHGEPITVAHKLLNWLDWVQEARIALEMALNNLQFGKISGAMGVYGDINPEVEMIACEILGLQPAKISTQILQRRAHARFVSAIAEFGGVLQQIAQAIWLGQQTERQEFLEPFEEGQQGSSRMPHKQNPYLCERIIGQSRVLRGYAAAMQESIATADERDISQSSVERIVFPDATILLDYMLDKMAWIVSNMEILPQNMLRNMGLTQGVIYSGYVKSLLSRKGATGNIYKLLQQCAFTAIKEGRPYQEVLASEPEISRYINQEELAVCFDHLKLLKEPLEEIYQRFGIVDMLDTRCWTPSV